METKEDIFEIIAFSDMDPTSEEVIIILAAGLDESEVGKLNFKISRQGNFYIVDLNDGAQIHQGQCNSPNQFNWKKARLGILDNEMILRYTPFQELE